MTNDYDHIKYLQQELVRVQAERDREHSMRVAAEHRLNAAIGERDEALERLYKATRIRDGVLLRDQPLPTSRPPESIL
jgi:hypothetical protein